MIYVNSVNVKESYIRLILNEVYYNPQAIISPANATCPYVTWSTSHPDVVSVDPEFGNIRALKAGTALVHATAADGGGAGDDIIVRVVEGPVSDISIESYLDLTEGGRGELNAVLSPSTATYADIVWTSDDPEIATVTGGIVNAHKAGSTFIRAVAVDNTDIFDSCYVTVAPVEKLVTSISLNETSISMPAQTSFFLRADIEPFDATNKTIEWISSNENIATVAQNGRVYTRNAGDVKITAKAMDGSGLEAYCQIHVTRYVSLTDINISEEETMKVGETKTLQATIIPSDATNKTIMWYSCCPEIASVGLYTGEITAHQLGKVEIYATAANGSITAKCTLRVVIENVTIQQVDGGGFIDVIFESGKVWKCIGFDTLYNSSGMDISFLDDRRNFNFFTGKNGLLYIQEAKDYTDEELRLLYAIDPYGVADYISKYADIIVKRDALNEYAKLDANEKDKKVAEEIVKYKDEKYTMLFGEAPKYYKRIVTNQYEWIPTTGEYNIDDVLSQSEALFGIRKVWDEITDERLESFVTDMLTSYYLVESGLSVVIDGFNEAIRIYNMISMIGKEGFAEEVVKYSADKVASYIIDSVPFLSDMIDVYNGIKSIDEVAVVNADFCPKPIYYYAYDSTYNISIKRNNNNNVALNIIYNDIMSS